MVNVDHQNEVEGVGWKSGIGRSSENHVDVLELAVGNVLPEQRDHPILNIFGNDSSGWSDNIGESPCVIAHSRSNIRHDRARLDFQRGQHAIRIFFLNSFRPRQPVRSRHSHDRRGLPLNCLCLRECEKEQNGNQNGSKFQHGAQC